MFNLFSSKKIGRFIFTGICSLSFLLHAQPASANYYGDDCCQDDCCCSNWGQTALIIGGAAVVGGIAGAIAGRSNNHGHSHSGDSGPVGLRGPRGVVGPTGSPFVADVGETLAFQTTAPLVGALLAGETLTLTPFVSRPDGTVLEGNPEVLIGPIPALGAMLPTALDTLVVVDPVFGTYTVGYQITSTATTAITAFLEEIVTASRDLSTTTYDFVGDITVGPAEQTQVDVEFTYGEENVP